MARSFDKRDVNLQSSNALDGAAGLTCVMAGHRYVLINESVDRVVGGHIKAAVGMQNGLERFDRSAAAGGDRQ